MKTAHVYFVKESEKDNWNEGLIGERQFVYEEKFTVDFVDTNDLKEKLAKYLTGHFDVCNADFIKYGEKDDENNSFIYSQNECVDGNKVTLTEENPNGYLSDYTFYITKVTQEIEYTF
ncbi:hypothetical protein vBBceHLY2_00122 [Bacillus phage vB_BceH_LY2]|nr:hypothetical protein vBBceHLY2_00122 [Bacillus phage vB_BceH_LY2]